MPINQEVRIEIIDSEVAAALRRKSPADRLAMIVAANRTARLLAEAGVRFVHPNWSNAQVQAEVNRRVSGGSS